mmetsp:Transcript_8246/g.25506  ORF Transcript_8246/g.25506 Transcript_8246/m.25506 type:complete len:1584 (-) Transcript_8246:1211-5962(-)
MASTTKQPPFGSYLSKDLTQSALVFPEEEDKEDPGEAENIRLVMTPLETTEEQSEAVYPSEPLDLADVDVNASVTSRTPMRQIGPYRTASTRRSAALGRTSAQGNGRGATPSLTTQDFRDLTAAAISRPRGSDSSGDNYATFTTRAHRTRVYRSWCARVGYTFLLLNMIVWVPLWLKLLTVKRYESQESEPVSVWNSSIEMVLNVSTFERPSTECGVCDSADDGEFGVTYPISATVKNFHDYDGISTASYISLLASYDFNNWFTVNQPGLLTGLPPGDSQTQVCRSDPIPLDDDEAEEDDEEADDVEASGSKKSTTFTVTSKETTRADTEYTEDGAVDLVEYTEIVTEFVTAGPTTVDEKATPAPTVLDEDDAVISRCCLDKPGFIYFVACASPYEYLQVADFYTKVERPPFDDQCIAMASRCGVACNVDADAPRENTCVNGEIPLKELVRKKFLPDDYDDDMYRRRLGGNGNGRRHYDGRLQFESWHASLYHGTFVFFVTLMAMGTWITFFAGTGSIQEPLKPSMFEVEAYMATDGQNDPTKKPLCLVAFSISASEPRMMVLRNMAGKLMSWIYQRKFTLSARAGAEAKTDAADAQTAEDPRSTTQRQPTQKEIMAATMTEYVEFIDMFADEGHRVGAYALWDAFVDLIHEADLCFVENMANKMTTMTAEDDRLLSKTEDDELCLDDELREMAASKPDVMRITQEEIDQLELAFAMFDLLTALGHPGFWRTDHSLNVTGFRELASNTEACEALRLWAKNFKKERKRSGNPFAPNCAPTSHKGIDQVTWNGWWDLYDEIGRNQWVKRFDCTKFRRVRVHYDRAQHGDSHYRSLMMCYTARANPEDLKIQLGLTVQRRGIVKGVFVRLKESCGSGDDAVAKLFKKHGFLQPLSRGEARRCHARVVSNKIMIKGVAYVKVKECTPDLLLVLPEKFLVGANELGDGDVEDEQSGRLLEGYKDGPIQEFEMQGEEAIIPIELLQPLRESRGKSGGMNHAMEILNFYIRHHSTTMRLMKKNALYEQRSGKHRQTPGTTSVDMDVPAVSPTRETKACLLFAIFDCRHMATQGYWDCVVPYFFKYRYLNNPWSRELSIDRPVAFVQLPQTFNSLTIDNDIFDMRNEYLFRLANNIRSGVGAITSCGTNAVWNYDLYLQENPLEHRFNEDTMIEDTASSHDVIIAGRKGVYHFERLVLGARKGTTDYLAAVFRWSRGAVQLFWTTFWFPRYKYVWPWAVLFLHVAPLAGCTLYLQRAKLDRCHQTMLTQRIGWVPCRSGPFLGLIADPVFICYALIMITLASASFTFHRLGAYTVMFENVTYFFSSVSAFYWTSLPLTICIAKNGVPAIFDTQLLSLGALWLQLHSALLIQFIKSWSPLENGNAPSDQSLLRSQQMYIVTAPLHLLAIIFGMKDGFEICFSRKDASRWSSFDSVMAMTAVKVYVIALFVLLHVAIVWGVVNGIIYDDGLEERGVRALGIFFCIMLLFLLWTPVRAMFFYTSVIKAKSKPSRMDRLSTAVFGKKQPLRFDYVYLLLWVFLIVYVFQRNRLGESDGIFNMRSRCTNDPDAGGCDPVQLFKFTRVEGEGLVQDR